MEKTKLKIIIEVEETFDDTFDLIKKIESTDGIINVKDLLSQDTKLIATQWSGTIEAINSVVRIVNGKIAYPPEPKVTEVRFILEGRRFDK